jgi:hypothetical protein
MKPCRRAAMFALLLWPALAAADPLISDAERRLFLDAHLADLEGLVTLRYRYARTGTLEDGFEDQVRVTLQPSDAAGGKRAHVEYLTGSRALPLPDIESAVGNPVILSFLERDVREMQRVTGGQAGYFRKRVRLALANEAQVITTRLQLGGHDVDAVLIVVQPYAQDPMRARFPRYVHKTYSFTLSQEVPGMVYEMHTLTPDPSGAAPFTEERLTYTAAER